MKKPRFLFLAIIIVLLISFAIPAFAIASSEDVEESIAYKNYVAVELNALFMDAVEQNQSLKNAYGGAYIDKDGNYNILITSEDALCTLKNTVTTGSISKVIDTALSDEMVSTRTAKSVKDLSVNYHIATFSYHYLSEIVDLLSANMAELGIEQVGVKQADNTVDIYVNASADQSDILSFLDKNFTDFDSEAVRFVKGDALYATANKTAYPGDEIYYTSWLSTYSGTIGFHAKDSSGNYGLVTNSHVAPSGQSMKYDGTTIGEPSYSTISGSIDAAFIPFDDTLFTTWQSTYQLKKYGTTIYGSIYDVASSSQIVEGARVKKYGITSLDNYGYITYTSNSATFYDHDGNLLGTLTDCIYFDNITQDGDSGGPVGLVAPIAKAKFYLAAITFAGNSTTGVGCKVSNIVDAFDITPVTSVNP